MTAAAAPADARVLLVGAGEAFERPSDAAAAARPGDVVRIAAGTYYDCAIWPQDSLLIVGSGPDTVLTDRTCQGKAIMIITGRDVVVRDLVFARARVPDDNGAGIRAEGANLTVSRVRFDNNQIGLLAPDRQAGILRIEDCDFMMNGLTDPDRRSASLVVGNWARVVVIGSRFGSGRGGGAILSQAELTEVRASALRVAPGHVGPAIEVAGALIIEDSWLQPGQGPGGRRAAVLALPGVTAQDGPLVLRRNGLAEPGILLLNWSGRRAELTENTLPPGAVGETSAGARRYRLSVAARQCLALLRELLAGLRRLLSAQQSAASSVRG